MRVYPSTMVVVLSREILAVVATCTAFFQESPVIALSIPEVTKAVVASWVVLVPGVAVGAVGVPERAGEIRGAFSVSSSLRAVCTLMLAMFPAGVLMT